MKSAILAVMACGMMHGGCEEDQSTSECGRDGALITWEGEKLCAYKQPIVIETGFACPAAYPRRQDFNSFSVCRASSDRLGADEVEELEAILSQDFGWTFNWKVEGVVIEPGPDMESMVPRVTGDKIDMLFVLDNSFSMCEEQSVLRDNINLFLKEITSKDFHIGVTTTHAPEGAGVIEPIAQEAYLQSTPQPVPGHHIGCLGDRSNDYAPLRESLDVARECLADVTMTDQFVWTSEQIACANLSPTRQSQEGCVASSNLPDRNGDTFYDIFDLFPDYDMYRPLPKVFRKQDYLLTGSGELDLVRLEADLRCVMTVGTRGDGYEKGLRVAVNAVSPEMTGVIAGMDGVDTSAPNYGFVRQNAKFGVVFVTDENDCSHNGEIEELGNACGSNIRVHELQADHERRGEQARPDLRARRHARGEPDDEQATGGVPGRHLRGEHHRHLQAL